MFRFIKQLHNRLYALQPNGIQLELIWVVKPVV